MPESRWILGVDIGGTSCSVGAVPMEGGEPVALRSRPTRPERGAGAIIGMLADMVEKTLDQLREETGDGRDSVAGMGIGSPGPLDRERGVVVETPNLGWRDLPLRDLMTEATGFRATLDNDANCATFGEWWIGAGKDASTVVGITLGTGIGGGIVLNGEIHHGASDVGGEIGHMTVRYDGRRCKCGNRGCLEAYASGPNIAARAVEGLGDHRDSILAGENPSEITAARVYDAILKGDRYAQEVMTETARILGAGIASVLNVLNPNVVVIAGGVTRAGRHLFVPLREEVARRAFTSAVNHCRIMPARLPETAGVIGAAGVYKQVTYGSA
ncbi:MAG: ROK family protein [Gemmatimonadota bacterium]